MANFLYSYGKSEMLKGNIDMVNDVINVALIKNTYTPNQALASANYTTHMATHVVGTPVALGNKSVSGTGVFDADDATFTSVASGSRVLGFLIYHSTTGTLIGWVDTGTGLPFATNNGNVTLTFSSGASKIFAL
mgnify:FL=1